MVLSGGEGFLFVEADAAASFAGVFHVIENGVRREVEVRELLMRAAGETATDAQVEVKLLVVILKEKAELLTDFLTNFLCIGRISDSVKEDHELITAKPGDDVFSLYMGEADAGKLLEDPVSFNMPPKIVDGFEVVNISNKQCIFSRTVECPVDER